MFDQSNRPRAGSAPSACLDCGGIGRCADTCPTARAFDVRLDADLARLESRDGASFVRPISAVEREFLARCGLPIARRDRRRFAVRVRRIGADAVSRDVLCDGVETRVALDDEPTTAGAR